MKIYLKRKEDRDKLKSTKEYTEILNYLTDFNIFKNFSIGYITDLISKYSTYEEWVNGYFASGEERQELLASLDSITRKGNNDFDYYMKTGRVPKSAIYDYNTKYGRTRENLGDFAYFVQNQLLEKNISYPLEDIYAVLYMNVIQIPWERIK